MSNIDITLLDKRVKCTNPNRSTSNYDLQDKEGIIIGISKEVRHPYLVQFENWSKGHDGRGNTVFQGKLPKQESKDCRYLHAEEFIIVDPIVNNYEIF